MTNKSAFTIDASELVALEKAMKQWPDAIFKEATPEIRTLTRQTRLQVQKRLTWNRGDGSTGGLFTGQLRRSINDEMTQSANGEPAGSVHTDIERSIFVEEDTRPHFPPLRALENWARFHNTSPWVVAQAIARKGTKGRHMFRDAAQWAERRIPVTAQKIARAALPKLKVK